MRVKKRRKFVIRAKDMCQSHVEHVTPSPNAFIGNINCSMTFEHKMAKTGIRH